MIRKGLLAQLVLVHPQREEGMENASPKSAKHSVPARSLSRVLLLQVHNILVLQILR